MKINSFFSVLLFVAAILFAGASLSSCGDGDDNKNNPEGGGNSGDGSKSQGQWYIELGRNSQTPYTVDLIQVYIDATTYYHGTPTLEGLRKEHTEGYTLILHIIDDNTLEYISPSAFYYANPGLTDKQLLYRVNTSSVLGTLALYKDSSTPYTYEKIDNKIYVPLQGTIFTVTSSGLWEDGGKMYYSYNPETALYTIPPESYHTPE